MSTQIQIRRDTAANWTSNDPVLAVGEMGFETDDKGMKIGDGSTAWTSLAYSIPPITDECVFVGGNDFYSGNYGSPTLSVLAGASPPFDTMRVAQLNDNEGVGWEGKLPNHWKSYSIHYYWANSGTGSGNVEWQCYWSAHGDGDVVRNGTAEYSAIATVAAPTVATELVVSQIGTTYTGGVNAASPQMLHCMFNRHSTSTLVGDSYLYGVEFRRAS